MAQAGVVGGYLNKRQMTALEQVIEERGISRGQVIKEYIIRGLIEAGKIDELELKMVQAKQVDLMVFPHGNAGEELREAAARKLADPSPRRRRRRMAR